MSSTAAQAWLAGIAIALGIGLAGWIVLQLLARLLPGWLRRSRTKLDDLLFAALRRHVPAWFLVTGVAIGARRAPLPPETLQWVDRVVVAILVLSVSIAAASLLTRLLTLRAAPGLERLPVNTLIQNVIRVAILSLGVLVVLGNLGVSITPILTALGVGSLAVALALQPTLSNLFAGFHITLARLVRVGDYVELEAGQKGYVVDIGWRSTVIRELADNTYIVPNARLSEMIVKNYSLPGVDYGIAVDFLMAHGTDLEQAERVVAEEAAGVQAGHAGAAPAGRAAVLYREWLPGGIRISAFLRVRDIRDQGSVTHELIKRIDRRLREAGIEILAPQRVLHVKPPEEALAGAPSPTGGPVPPAPPPTPRT
jgi:small-conductance mechanosensitive channel